MQIVNIFDSITFAKEARHEDNLIFDFSGIKNILKPDSFPEYFKHQETVPYNFRHKETVSFLRTISGIKKPNHRKKLKAAADELVIGDGLPVRVPGSVHEFLAVLRLQEYTSTLLSQVPRAECVCLYAYIVPGSVH